MQRTRTNEEMREKNYQYGKEKSNVQAIIYEKKRKGMNKREAVIKESLGKKVFFKKLAGF